MQKKLLSVLFILSVITVNAQKGSYGLELSLGSSNAINKNLSTGFSGTLGAFYHTSNLGVLKLNYTSVTNGIKNFNPKTVLHNQFLTVGYQQYFSNKRNLFATADAGLNIVSRNIFPAAALGLGYTIHAKNGGFDIGLKYMNSFGSGSNNMWLLPQIGFKIKLGK